MSWKNNFILFLVCCSFFFFSCQSKEVTKYEESRFLFGTYIKIITYTTDGKKAKKAMENAFEEIERIDKKFNSKTETSLIYQLNHSDTRQIDINPELFSLLKEVGKAYRLSSGKYDITIAPLLELWGFEEGKEPHLPTTEEVKEALLNIDFEKAKVEKQRLTLLPSVKEIDTGSFLKGYAIAKAREIMEKAGIESCLITSISSIELLGKKPGGQPWRIALENPNDSNEIIGILSLANQALGVSGDYQTYLEIGGQKYHHILDKTTGYPVTDKKMVALICPNAFLADVYSTCFFLMPIDEVIQYVNSKEDWEVLVIDKNMNFHMSANFEQYFSKK